MLTYKMKLVFFILFSSTLEIILTTCASVPTIHKRDFEKIASAKANKINNAGATGPPTEKVRTGTRTFEDEDGMRKSFSEMGRKGGLATKQAYLKKANGNPRLATKLRSNAAKESMKVRQEKHAQQTGKERYERSNEAYRARFEASANKAKEKGSLSDGSSPSSE